MSYAKICQVASRRCSPHFSTQISSPSLLFCLGFFLLFFFLLFLFFEGSGRRGEKRGGERTCVRKIPKEWLVYYFFLGFQTATSSAHCERA
jgi:hypothetical protein